MEYSGIMEFIEENWLIFSIVCGFVAKSIGRSFWKYFFLSLFLSPIIGFVVLLIKGKKEPETEAVVIKTETSDDVYQPQSSSIIPPRSINYCINCGAAIEPNAKFCSNCGYDLRTKQQ